MTALSALKGFDVTAAAVSLWVFRSTSNAGVPSFKGRWIGMTDRLDQAIKSAVRGGIDAITETIAYDILAQNNEGSALCIGSDETYAALLVENAQNEVPEDKVRTLKHLQNIKFYAVKLVINGSTLFAVRRSDDTWKTRKSNGILKVFYEDDELDLDDRPSFSISSYFDFYLLGEHILISSKSAFESVLQYRVAHAEAFQTLQAEPAFSNLFVEMQPLVDFVGTNKIQLRRAIAIQQKGHYKDAAFMANLKAECSGMNLNIGFDDAGLIIATPDTCQDIFRALLDHRLDSRLSRKLYDVPNAEVVG